MTKQTNRESVLGAVLAGGMNRRYDGQPKALETVGGERIIDRALRAMRQAVDRVVLVANEAQPYESLGLEIRPDLEPGLGALGGIRTAVAWAEEAGFRGALVAACDMPFLSAALLERLIEESSAHDVVAPESDSRRGLEPLCAFYSTSCRPAIERALDRGDRQVISFYFDAQVRTIARDEVATFGDLNLLFLNVNSPEDRERAEAAARGSEATEP